MFENVDGRTDGRTDGGRTDAGVTGILLAHPRAFGTGELTIVREYDQEIPQSETADKPMTLRGRATQPSLDTITRHHHKTPGRQSIYKTPTTGVIVNTELTATESMS